MDRAQLKVRDGTAKWSDPTQWTMNPDYLGRDTITELLGDAPDYISKSHSQMRLERSIFESENERRRSHFKTRGLTADEA